MRLGPTPVERLARARADLRMGVPVVLGGPSGGLVFLAAETLDPARLAQLTAMAAHLTLVITTRRAATLKARAYDGDIARLRVPADASPGWVHAVANPADDLKSPMKGPFQSLRGGDAAPHRAAFAAEHGLTMVLLAEAETAIQASSPLNPVVSARVPLDVSEAGRVHVFRPEDGGEEHYAIEIGAPARNTPVLARLHSACFTGDLLGSLKCDCGPQLRGALAQMGREGAGVLLYLNQEGRGIGLANKMRAYSLQDQGFDTVEANHRLGFEDDERDFRLGASILKQMGFSQVRLMTNNPAKLAMLAANGLTVTERVPLKVGETGHNAHYLATKAAKSGHLL
jgi:GTP cyclohydrolase II